MYLYIYFQLHYKMVTKIESEEQFNKVIESDVLTVVDFYAEWCGPCHRIAPQVEQLAKNNPNVNFVKLDVDKFGELTENQKISAMPTFVFYKNGKEVDRFSGANPTKLEEYVKKLE